MSWIDKKYKNHFKEQKYPEGMKQRGWDSMQSLLDKQMPVSSPKGITSNPWFISCVAAVVVAVVAVPLFIANQSKEVSRENNLPAPSSIQMNPSDGISISPNSKELQPSDFNTEETNAEPTNVAVESFDDNSQPIRTEPSEAVGQEVVSESIADAPTIIEETGESPVQDEPQIEGGENDVIVATNQVADPAVQESTVYEEEQQGREAGVLVPLAVRPEAVANEALAEGDGQTVHEEASVSSPETVIAEVSENKVESTEVVVEPAAQTESVNVLTEKTEPIVAVAEEKENQVLATAETDDIEEVEVETTNEGRNESVDVSENVNHTKAAHLAFLEAEAQAPIPDLLAFSKERFALSIWGGYLFTGKVLSGGDKDDLEKRKAAEKPIYTIPTGVALDYFVDEHWTVGIGLGWAEYGEDVDYTLYNVTSTIDTVAFDGRYDSPANYPNIISIDSTRVIDTINQGHWNYNLTHRNDDSTANYYSGRNTFRYIEVPLTVGYRFGTGRIKPWVKAGVIVGLPMETSYRYPQFETSTYSEGTSKATLAAIQYSGLFQVGVDCYINRAFSVRLNALGSYQLNSILSNEGVRQRYYRVGASLGLAYNF